MSLSRAFEQFPSDGQGDIIVLFSQDEAVSLQLLADAWTRDVPSTWAYTVLHGLASLAGVPTSSHMNAPGDKTLVYKELFAKDFAGDTEIGSVRLIFRAWVYLVLCTFGKSVSTYLGMWVENRLRAFCGLANVDPMEAPPTDLVGAISGILDSSPEFRASLFTGLSNMGGADPFLVTIIPPARAITRFSRMGPLMSIIKYVVLPRDLTVLCHNDMRLEYLHLKAALTHLSKESEVDKGFAYHMNKDMSHYVRANFPVLTSYAIQKGSRTDTNLTRYQQVMQTELPEWMRLHLEKETGSVIEEETVSQVWQAAENVMMH